MARKLCRTDCLKIPSSSGLTRPLKFYVLLFLQPSSQPRGCIIVIYEDYSFQSNRFHWHPCDIPFRLQNSILDHQTTTIKFRSKQKLPEFPVTLEKLKHALRLNDDVPFIFVNGDRECARYRSVERSIRKLGNGQGQARWGIKILFEPGGPRRSHPTIIGRHGNRIFRVSHLCVHALSSVKLFHRRPVCK